MGVELRIEVAARDVADQRRHHRGRLDPRPPAGGRVPARVSSMVSSIQSRVARTPSDGTEAFDVVAAGDGGRRAPNRRVVIGRYGKVTPDQARRLRDLDEPPVDRGLAAKPRPLSQRQDR